tara:strand:+ start:149 stop:511 length:363 start_codon:yes stop_codon:yes gene_type:complete
MKNIIVFYDGNCNLCTSEINFYKKLDQKKTFNWVNINTRTDILRNYNIEFDDSLMYLHAIDKNGKKKIGVDAFITIWREFRYFKILSYLIGITPLKRFTDIIYNFWAKRRFKKIKNSCKF